jgi:DNA-binding transcriptional regulator YdaS (Cro superfamily)
MDIREIIKQGGGPASLARALGCHHTSISGWRRVPAERVPAVAAITGIPRHEIRPDLYEAPQEAA